MEESCGASLLSSHDDEIEVLMVVTHAYWLMDHATRANPYAGDEAAWP